MMNFFKRLSAISSISLFLVTVLAPVSYAGQFIFPSDPNPCSQTSEVTVSTSVKPSSIQFNDPSNPAYICYHFNVDIKSGHRFSISIWNGGNKVIRHVLDFVNIPFQAGEGDLIAWDGFNDFGAAVNPGDYFYKVFLDNALQGSGLITVTDNPKVNNGGNGNNPGDICVNPSGCIVYTVNPSTVIIDDPKTGTGKTLQSASIQFSVTKKVTTGLTVEIRSQQGNPLRTLFTQTPNPQIPLGVGDYAPLYWDGQLNGKPLLEGPYTYVFMSAGREIAFGTITIQYRVPQAPPSPQPPAIFISFQRVNPDRINPYLATDSGATISYTLGKDVTNFKLSVRNTTGTLSTVLRSVPNASAGVQPSATWDGKFAGLPAPNGTYFYTFEATNEAPVSGQITVTGAGSNNNPPPAAAPVITDSGPTLQKFNPKQQTIAFRYQVDQDSRVDLTILSGGITVRRLVISSPFNNNAVANQAYSITWDGSGDANIGTPLPDGTYTYFIQAINNNGTAQTKTGTVLLDSSGNNNNNVVLNVSGLKASSPAFDPNGSNNLPRSTNLQFNLNQPANVTITITNQLDGSFVKTLVANQPYGSGFNSIPWDGTDRSNINSVGNGTYNFRIDASSAQYGSDSKVGSVLVSTSNNGVNSGSMAITNVSADPSTIDPSGSSNYSRTTNFRFTLNHDASVTMTISGISTGNVVRRFSSQFYNAGPVAITWDGTDQSGFRVPNDTYNFRIDASSALYGSDYQVRTVQVGSGNNGNCGNGYNGNCYNNNYNNNCYNNNNNNYNYNNNCYSGTNLQNVYTDPNSFDPYNGGSPYRATTLRFTLIHDANITVTVNNATNNAFIKALVTNQRYSTGANSVVWDGGTDQPNIRVPNGTYNIRIDATSTYGFDSQTATVVVGYNNNNCYNNCYNYNTGSVVVSNFSADPYTFYPDTNTSANRNTTVRFTLNREAYVTITISQFDGTRVRTLVSGKYFAAGSGYAVWSGTNDNGNVVPSGVYDLRIDARNTTNSSDTNYSTAKTQVVKVGVGTDNNYNNPNKPVVNYNNSTGCAGFSDVSTNSYLCPAVKFVQSHAIFSGYADGTIGVNNVIQRAELLAVIQKAFHYQLDSYDPARDGNLGYSDLTGKTGMWYMPYIKTFSRLRLMTGYPDGTMRPTRTMNTAELYLVFVKAALQAPGSVTHFTLDNHVTYPPFIDTPLRDGWYIKYAQFAKLNDLVVTDRFYPDRGITRGKVMQLIYDTNQKGLISY